MARADAAILDFGSEKITVLVGERGVNNSINLLGTGEAPYGGFADGEFLQPELLPEAIAFAINNAETNSRRVIKQLFVGIPGEFTTAVVKDANINFPKKRKVTDFDVDELFEIGAQNYLERQDYEIVNQGAVYFQTDDNRRIVAPEGLLTTKLSGKLSYILGEKSFITLIGGALTGMGISDLEFVSSVMAEVLYLFEPEKRDQYVMLLDMGYITSTLALARGDGIITMHSFSVGGGHITGDIAQVLEVSFPEAEALKRKVILSLEAGEEDTYQINTKNGPKDFPAGTVNEIVEARLMMISDIIGKILIGNNTDYPQYIPLHLTGGGLSYMKGGKEFLSKQLGKPIELVASKQPMLNRPYMSSSLGMLDMAINQMPAPEKKGFFARLFGR